MSVNYSSNRSNSKHEVTRKRKAGFNIPGFWPIQALQQILEVLEKGYIIY